MKELNFIHSLGYSIQDRKAGDAAGKEGEIQAENMHRIIPGKPDLAMRGGERRGAMRAFSANSHASEEGVGPLFSSLALTTNRLASLKNLLFGHQS